MRAGEDQRPQLIPAVSSRDVAAVRFPAVCVPRRTQCSSRGLVVSDAAIASQRLGI
jgi:hypothetical protein